VRAETGGTSAVCVDGRVSHRSVHHRDVLLLLRDDGLGKAPEFVIVPVKKLGSSHVDDCLILRNHHRDGDRRYLWAPQLKPR
jgi:hypothetical protein